MPFFLNLIYEFNEFQSKCQQDTCGICKFTLSTNTGKKNPSCQEEPTQSQTGWETRSIGSKDIYGAMVTKTG